MDNKKIMLAVGLFDKNTKKQEIKTEEALQLVNNILLQYTEGATAYMGDGIYRHIDGSVVIEPNIIILLYDINKNTIDKIIAELKTSLNQECIMKEETSVYLSFV